MRALAKRASTVLLAAAAGCLLLLTGPASASAGIALAATASTATPAGHWTAAVPVPGLAKLNTGKNATLADLACASAGNCAAGGSYADREGGNQAWIATEAAGRWHAAEEVPGTARLNKGGNAILELVACPALNHCLAIGEAAGAALAQSAFVVTEGKGGTWSAARTIGDGMFATQIACPHLGDCLLGGLTAGGRASVAAERGAAWSAPLTLPGVAALGRQGSEISALTCTSPGNCVAAGTYDPAGQPSQQVFVASEVKGTWRRAVQVPGTGRLNSGHDAGISAISCASAGDCSVGGSYQNAAGEPFTFVANEVRGSWQAARTIPGSADPTRVYGGTVSGLRCTAAATCLAVGAAGADGFIAQEKNGTWGKIRLVADLTRFGTGLTALSCRSAGNCLATGSALLGSGDETYDPGAESFGIAETNGSWGKPKVLTVAGGGRTDSAVQSCTGSGNCSVGGNVQYGVSYQTSPAAQGAYVTSYTR